MNELAILWNLKFRPWKKIHYTLINSSNPWPDFLFFKFRVDPTLQ